MGKLSNIVPVSDLRREKELLLLPARGEREIETSEKCI